MSDLIPHMASNADDMCIIKSIHTEAINHDPGITYLQTGHQQPGRPSLGAWVSYGLGNENEDLARLHRSYFARERRARCAGAFPAAVGCGLLALRAPRRELSAPGKDAVLYLTNPPGVDKAARRRMLDGLAELNELHHARIRRSRDHVARISQYEMAYKMQTSVPDLMDISDEPDHISIFTATTRANRAPTPRTVSSRGAWRNAACASFSFITAAGISTATCRATSGCSAAMSIKHRPRS